MKHRMIFAILLVLVAGKTSAQWKGEIKYSEIMAYGVHDTNLFASYSGGGLTFVNRYSFNSGWAAVDATMNFSQGPVTSFTSIGRYFFASESGNGPGYRSSDDGASWIASVGGYICSNGQYVFAAVDEGIYRSGDSGSLTSWKKITTFTATVMATMGYHIFATSSSGLYRSTDTGADWAPVTYPLGPPVAFAVLDTVVFAGSSTGATGIAMSTDSGGTWQAIGFSHAVTALATDGKNLWAGTTDSGVYISTDRGQHWRNVSDGLKYYLQVTAMAVFDTMMIVGTVSPGSQNYYQAWRPISEMTSPPDAVAATPQPGDTLSIYPNPSTGVVTIFSGSTSIYGVRVLNVLGEEVLDMPNARESEMSIDVSKLPAGTYFFEIQTSNGTELRKIAIER